MLAENDQKQAVLLDSINQNQASLLAEIEALRAQILELRSAARPARTDASGDVPAVEVGHRTVSRRGMIAAVAGAAGGLLLTNTTPAAAADGHGVVLGDAGESSSETAIWFSGVGSGLKVGS